MSELITSPSGFLSDTRSAILKQTGAGTAYNRGDLVALSHADGAGAGLNSVVAAAATDASSKVYAVVTRTVTADEDISVMLRGSTDINYDNIGGAVTRALPALVPAIIDAGIVDAVSSAAGVAAAAGAKVIALYTGDGTEPAADGLITVMFDGLNGFGSVNL